MRNSILYFGLILLSLNILYAQDSQLVGQGSVTISEVQKPGNDSSGVRIKQGGIYLKKAFNKAGYHVDYLVIDLKKDPTRIVLIGLLSDNDIKKAIIQHHFVLGKMPGKEGYMIFSNKKVMIIAGVDQSGALYGCMEVADKVRQTGQFPVDLNISDQPEMVLRGACIGVQKPFYLPGRTVYEYPYTPVNFPWFYDKALWIKYLDMLVENRMNSLYLWNGHPFASLVKLKDYPCAIEVDDETFRKNEEIFSFLTREADKRGIWVIQMFYNILVSKPFAEKNNIKTQDRKRPITPLIADYTRKSIAAFVEKYPNVGLLITLGEAMEGDDTDVEWFTKTIIPGVKDGLAAMGTDIQPPVVLRGHDTNPQLVMKASLPLHKNLYTMNKYNGEALTTYQPQGPWAKMHREMSELGSTHIDNVHILANLEPFRYGSADFFSEKVKAALLVLKFTYSNDLAHLKSAVSHLENSVAHYQKLANLTKDTYLYANSMQTAQRRIPVGGDDGKNKTWVALLPYYQKELENFKSNLSLLEKGDKVRDLVAVLQPAEVSHNDKSLKFYSLETGQKLFKDDAATILDVADELKHLKGIQLNAEEQSDKQTTIAFKNTKPVKVLVGYFQSKEKRYLTPPNLETDASANDFGQAEVRISGALTATGLPPVNIQSYSFGAGDNKLVLGKGKVLVLGFIGGDVEIRPNGIPVGAGGVSKSIDWLFESKGDR